MGLIGTLMALLFGGGRNAVRETVEVFRPNAEAAEVRDATRAAAALGQFAAEFATPKRGWFDRGVDALNRLPRPLLAFGTIGLFVAAMAEPVWFAARMQGIALIPEALWWLMGAIVSFYFGARHQTKSQDFQRDMATTMALARKIEASVHEADSASELPRATFETDGNAAIDEWRAGRER